jgi:prepilin-type N-terminal cleavage/methylation domain-containing protein
MQLRARGFTLIEVLIAATILFVVIAAATEAYRGALQSSRRAEATVRLLTPLPLITAAVRDTLRSRPEERVSGSAELLGVAYEFAAVTAQYGSPAPRFDADLGDFTSYPPRFRLYDVRLTLRGAGAERTFAYQELAWEPVVR